MGTVRGPNLAGTKEEHFTLDVVKTLLVHWYKKRQRRVSRCECSTTLFRTRVRRVSVGRVECGVFLVL